ncbi:MAG TPA: PepSY-associated TM helix domain-containing protein, partial [Planctomycetaceae bacterium]
EAAYAAAHPGRPSRAAAVSKPRVANGVWTAWFQSGTEDALRWTMVYVDPYSGEVTGQRVWGTDLMGTIYRLHYTLLGGDAGATVVGVAGVVLMASVASGVWLWWPLWRSGWRAAFAIRRGRRFNYDFHKTTGIAAAPVLLIVAFTGVYMTFPEWITPVVAAFSDVTPPIEGLTSAPAAAGRSLTPEEAVAIALEQFPEASFDHFHPPQTPDGAYEVGLRQPGEVQRSFGATQVWIDRHTGSVLAVRNPDQLTAGDTFLAWQFPLHNGEAFGLPGRLLVFASGFAPAVLYVTGLVLWWRKRRPRGKRESTVPGSRQFAHVNRAT